MVRILDRLVTTLAQRAAFALQRRNIPRPIWLIKLAFIERRPLTEAEMEYAKQLVAKGRAPLV